MQAWRDHSNFSISRKRDFGPRKPPNALSGFAKASASRILPPWSELTGLFILVKRRSLSVLSLILILIVVTIGITAVLWAGTYYFQGYIYTEPSQGIAWQAPLAGIMLSTGFSVWCFSIALSARASTINIPINTIHRFSPIEEMVDRPIPKIWAIKPKKPGETGDGDRIAYESRRNDRGGFYYADTTLVHRPWRPQGIVAIETENTDGTKMRFDWVRDDTGPYRIFASKSGWSMIEFEEGPTGVPRKFHFLLLIWNLLFNGFHFLGWFVALWLILRFQMMHALGLAIVLWAVMTMTMLPMMLGYAGQVAENRRVRTVAQTAVSLPLPPV